MASILRGSDTLRLIRQTFGARNPRDHVTRKNGSPLYPKLPSTDSTKTLNKAAGLVFGVRNRFRQDSARAFRPGLSAGVDLNTSNRFFRRKPARSSASGACGRQAGSLARRYRRANGRFSPDRGKSTLVKPNRSLRMAKTCSTARRVCLPHRSNPFATARNEQSVPAPGSNECFRVWHAPRTPPGEMFLDRP